MSRRLNRSFPESENPADAGFLVGDYRPQGDITRMHL
jgi:hypothetical protein